MKRGPAVGRLRGKTRAGRLALWDALTMELGGPSLHSGFIEVGVGERADTVMELARRLAPVRVPLTVVELHPVRAEMVRAAVRDLGRVEVLEADALVPVVAPTAGVLRCANVLRQYPVHRVPDAHAALVTHVRLGGVVLEGSCDAGGDVGAFHVLRSTEGGGRREALVFFSTFQRGFAPIQFRDWLPRDLRREVRAGGVMRAFFDAWTDRWTQSRTGTPAVDFRRAAEGEGLRWLDLSATRPGAAAMVWTPPGGVPSPTAES